MSQRIAFIIVFACLSIFQKPAYCQVKNAHGDSTMIYKDIESYSDKSKFTKFLYKLVFKRATTVPVEKPKKKRQYKKLIQKPYSAFEGKIIRYIGIETLDPFGYIVADTIRSDQNFLSRSGNKLHVKSQRVTIRNLLLIRENQVFDSLLVKESERLVRSQKYVRDVLFYVVKSPGSKDSVDIYIRELDQWSLIPKGAFSASSMKIQLNDKNILGFGHEFSNAYYWNHTTGKDAFATKYYVPNIRNSYISTTFQYGTDEYGNFTLGMAVDRPFFSPFAQWAGGIALKNSQFNNSLLVSDTVNADVGYKFFTQDYWLGHSIQIFKGNTEYKRTTNFIYTIRYTQIDYQLKPIESIDTLNIFSNEHFYMASVGVSTRKYVRDKYIFGFGVTEDVPVGKVYSLTGGYRERHNSGNLYMGTRVSFGNYYTWGYFGTNCEYGTFIQSGIAKQGVVIAGLSYFTGLLQIGKWKFRQFVKPQITFGIDRNAPDSLTIKDGYGIDGFNSSGLSGTNRILVALQSQSYAPWNVIGFRFGPFLTFSAGMLGDAENGFRHSRVYTQIGFGFLIKNENLVIETFQVSVSFYPIIPGVGNDVFKVNSFKSTDFGFRDFEIGKPGIVLFQ